MTSLRNIVGDMTNEGRTTYMRFSTLGVSFISLAGAEGLEPPSVWLTARCCTG